MNKIISISLWGNLPRYSIGAIRNAELGEKYFPDWKIRIYYENSVIKEHIQILSEKPNVELVNFSHMENIAPCFWRFFAMFEDENNIVLSRDSDSRLSLREKLCIDSWLTSSKKYSIIRDHVRHYDFPILAGMWGYKGKMDDSLYQTMLNYAKSNYYTVDQIFLKDILWDKVREDSLIFGLYENEEFNITRKDILPNFVGQGYDEYDRPIYPVE